MTPHDPYNDRRCWFCGIQNSWEAYEAHIGWHDLMQTFRALEDGLSATPVRQSYEEREDYLEAQKRLEAAALASLEIK